MIESMPPAPSYRRVDMAFMLLLRRYRRFPGADAPRRWHHGGSDRDFGADVASPISDMSPLCHILAWL